MITHNNEHVMEQNEAELSKRKHQMSLVISAASLWTRLNDDSTNNDNDNTSNHDNYHY